jgi:phosphate ABC transporter phosphate-binding protein
MVSTRSIARAVAGAAAVTLLALGAGPATPVRAAPTKVAVSGAGSTWSSNAIDAWRRDVQQNGVVINYAATGSSDGRNQFANGTVDFGVSEIPYGQPDQFVAGDGAPSRKFAYMPIVAGGTAFMYHLKIGGKRVTNLRLSGATIAKIFSGTITRWNDPAIRADNPGLNLPARRVVPVVRSDGSGTTAQFTLWLSKEHQGEWNKVCQRVGKPSPCGQTSYFPSSLPGFVRQARSDGVAGYVGQANADGAITYVEYSYALNARFPVAKVLNRSGYYVEPTAQNVAVGLLGARINNDQNSALYLTQQLDGVYRNGDRRTYPLSSYSYMIIPHALERGMTVNKGYTLGLFTYHFLCEGQRQADVLGYSPLPINLVQAGFEQVRKIPGVEVQSINVQSCNNPTFSRDGTNTLARTAPYPPACDKQGATQCSTGTGGARNTPTQTSNGGPGSTSGTQNAPGTGAGPGGTGPSSSASAAAGAGPTASGAAVDPDTGELLASDGGTAGGPDVAGVPVALDAHSGWGLRHTMMALAAALLAGVMLGPPLISRNLRGRRDGRGAR